MPHDFERYLELKAIWREIAETNRLLRRILHAVNPKNVKSFKAVLESNMPQNPGATAVIQFTPVPADATLTQPPVITSSDDVNAPVTADATGLLATINFPTSAAAVPYVLTCSYTNPDGDVATGTFDGQIVLPTVDVTGFTSAEVS